MSKRVFGVSLAYFAFLPFLFLILLSASDPCFANFESSLMGIKSKLTDIILPVLSVIGLAVAAISFFTGNPNAKTTIFYAILGCIFGFGAEAIVDMIASTVR